MSRPSLAASDHHHHFETEEEQPHFPRRLPKIGNAFQCKNLPKPADSDKYEHSERVLERLVLSEETPEGIISSEPPPQPQAAAAAAAASIPLRYETVVTTTKRGGSLLHRSSSSATITSNNSNKNAAKPSNTRTITTRNQQQQQQREMEIDARRHWSDELVRWYKQQQQPYQTTGETTRRPRKCSRYNNSNNRKRSAEDAAGSSSYDHTRGPPPPLLQLWDDEAVVTSQLLPDNNNIISVDQYHQSVWRRHGGNVHQEAWYRACQYNGGHAVRTWKRKRRRSQNNNNNKNSDTTNTTQQLDNNWRRLLLDDRHNNSAVAISGDFRNTTHNARAADEQGLLIADDEDHEGKQQQHLELVWNAVVECARYVLSTTTTTNTTTVEKVPLSAVAQFLQNAACLPPPPNDNNDDDRLVDHVMEELTRIYITCQYQQAKLLDLWWGGEGRGTEGVDTELLRKKLTDAETKCVFEISQLPELKRQLDMVTSWQHRLEEAYNHCHRSNSNDENENDLDDESSSRNDLFAFEQLLRQGQLHGFRSKALVGLEAKVERAHQVRDRILAWRKNNNNGGDKTTIKFVAAIVRDIYRLKLKFPVANEMLRFYDMAESWVERANIAIRSRISYFEIQDLMRRGRDMPLDLSEFTEKLQLRLNLAKEWLESFEHVLGSTHRYTCNEPSQQQHADDERNSNNMMTDSDKLKLLYRIRTELGNGRYNQMHELATNGSRVPVEMELVKLLQIQLDADAWTAKARKWLPSFEDSSSRRGKLEDLRDHCVKATALHERLALKTTSASLGETENGIGWELEAESELRSIVRAADYWLDKNSLILNGSSSDNDDDEEEDEEGHASFSVAELREIAREGNAVYANMGTGLSKVGRILAQAEGWAKEHSGLWERCQTSGSGSPTDIKNVATIVHLPELKAAVDAATGNIPVDLKEASYLKNLADKIESWFHRAAVAIGDKKPSRHLRGFSIDDVIALIDEAKHLPVETAQPVARLQEQLRLVKEWQTRVSSDVDAILAGFSYLREAINESYGQPCEYKRVQPNDESAEEEDSNENDSRSTESRIASESMDLLEERKAMDESSSHCDGTVSVAASELDMNALVHLGSGDCNVQNLIRAFCRESKRTCIVTPESEIALQLEKVSRWCMRSLKYLENPRDVFDKRFFGAFDRFLKEGQDLSFDSCKEPEDTPESELGTLQRLRRESGCIVADQLERLKVLLADRKTFIVLCDRVEQLLASGDRRPSLDKLKELSVKTYDFPGGCGCIRKIRVLVSKASEWTRSAKAALSSSTKMSLHEAAALFSKGEKLGFTCDELKMLRSGLKEARSWSKRVKRCKLEQSAAHYEEVNRLLEDHESLIVRMPPDEVVKLQAAVKNYCLCRRPYEGFMIGCDQCGDWFHGPCIGVSETRADRFSKYVCLRCVLSKTYTTSASKVVDIVRKWTCEKDLKKARNLVFLKHKRKVRKEEKEIEKYQKRAEEIRGELASHRSMEGQNNTAGAAAGPNTQLHANIEGRPMPDSSSGPGSPRPLAAPVGDFSAKQLIPANGGTAVRDNGIVVLRESSEAAPSDDRNGMFSHNDVKTGNSNIKMGVTGGSGGTFCESEKPDCAAGSDDVDGLQLKNQEVNKQNSSLPVLDADRSHHSNELDNTTVVGLKEQLMSQLNKIMASIQKCETRLSKLVVLENKQKREETIEDANCTQLRRWVVRVRCLVLVPSTKEQVDLSRPERDGKVSSEMLKLEEEAKYVGLFALSDVKTVCSAFRSIAWSLSAMKILRRQPSSSEITSLVDKAGTIDLPDEKALRLLKSMAQRVSSWEAKVEKALAPNPEEKKPFNLSLLKELSEAGDHIPVHMPLEHRLASVIDDGGCRHCLCGGPSDGRFMVGCDKCDRWYHGHCVQVSKCTAEDDMAEWKCPPCAGSPTANLDLRGFYQKYDAEFADDSDSEDSEDASSKAPDPDELWPPYGLFGSDKAKEVLGAACCDIADIMKDSTPTGFGGLPANGSRVVSATTSSDIVPSEPSSSLPLEFALALDTHSVGYSGAPSEGATKPSKKRKVSGNSCPGREASIAGFNGNPTDDLLQAPSSTVVEDSPDNIFDKPPPRADAPAVACSNGVLSRPLSALPPSEAAALLLGIVPSTSISQVQSATSLPSSLSAANPVSSSFEFSFQGGLPGNDMLQPTAVSSSDSTNTKAQSLTFSNSVRLEDKMDTST